MPARVEVTAGSTVTVLAYEPEGSNAVAVRESTSQAGRTDRIGGIGLYTSWRLWDTAPHDLALPPLEPRLQACYLALVNGLQRGGRSATPGRAGDAPPPDAATLAASFAQKLWRFTTADAVLSTRPHPIADHPAAHVDQLLPAMTAVAALALPARLVHVVDREADSVGHWRQWDPTHVVLVRADDRHVVWDGEPTKLSAVHAAVRERGGFADGGAARYRGRKARLFVAEAAVVLDRPAKRKVGGRSVEVPGRPLELRVVMTEVRDADGAVLARWWLLTNAPAEWGASADVARWYYYRWRIESAFKLLKSAGWDVEGWLQRTGAGLLRKLLVALGGCVQVWRLQAREDASAEWLKELLMRLSGRQAKRSQPVTTSGLLAGLWVWQSAQGVIGDHGADTVERLVAEHLPLFAPPPRPKKVV